MDSSVKKALQDIANALQNVFSKHTRPTREKAWDKVTSKKGLQEIEKIIRNPSKPVNTITKLFPEHQMKFKNWLND
jgi:hypothetical protein